MMDSKIIALIVIAAIGIGAILFIIALAKTGDPNENQYGEII